MDKYADLVEAEPCSGCGGTVRYKLSGNCPTCYDREYRRRRKESQERAKKQLTLGTPCEKCSCTYRHTTTGRCVVCAADEARGKYAAALDRLSERHRRVCQKGWDSLPKRRFQHSLPEGVRFVISFNGEDETVIENGTWSEVPVGPTDLPPWAANFHTRNLKRLLAWVERYEAASRTYTLMVSGRQNSRRKRAESAGASTGNYTVAEMNKKVHRLGRACFYCGGPYQHDDHFLALSRFGIDTIENIVPACEACNESKGDSDPWEWMARRLQQGLLTNSRLCFALSSIEADASPKGLAALEQAFISAPPEILGPAKRPTRTYRLK